MSFYRKYCLSTERANYIDLLENSKDRSTIAKFRLSAHNLQIEKGRQNNIAREDRTCKSCTGSRIEDDEHFI